MKITLKAIGILEENIKTQDFIFPNDSILLSQFFCFLAERYGSMVREHLMPEGKFSSHYIIFINGKNIKLLKGFGTELKDGDKIFITTLVDGG
jgi:molybdopterin converting factor small subunit